MTTIYPLTVADMQCASSSAQQWMMDGFLYLRRREYTQIDYWVAINAGAAIERNDKQALITQEADAARCERMARTRKDID